jgi:hypothetical protein
MRHSAESIFVVEHLREFESICKIVLTIYLLTLRDVLAATYRIEH